MKVDLYFFHILPSVGVEFASLSCVAVAFVFNKFHLLYF